MEKYYYVNLGVPVEVEGKVDAYAMERFLCTGMEEFSIEEARVDEILGERSYSGGDLPVSVLEEVEETLYSGQKKYYFETQGMAHEFSEFVRAEFELTAEIFEEEKKDWNSEWKKSYAPIYVGPTLEIIPSWDKDSYVSKSEKSLYIYPGMGFGTGGHETTFLCLKLFTTLLSEKRDFEDCLDFGCGSGILGIGARLFFDNLKLDLYDIDQEALDNSQQNIELNEVSKEGIRLLLPKGREQILKKYDLVFANILQNVLLEEKSYLACSLRPGGALILSGLLKGQEDEVISEYLKLNCDLGSVDVIQKGDWVAVIMRLTK